MNSSIKKICFISLIGAFALFVSAHTALGQIVEQKIQARQQFLGVRSAAKSVMIQSINNAIALRKLQDIEVAKAAFIQAVSQGVVNILYPIFGSAYSSAGAVPVVASTAFVEKISSPLSVTCSGSPSEININQSVVWSAVYSGGNASYSFSWSGSDGLEGAESAITKTYSSAGRKTANVSVSSGGQTVTKSCGAISVTDPSSMIQKVLTFLGLGKNVTSTSPNACGEGSTGGWSTCSATCGGGTQTRIIVNSDCTNHTESQSCNAETCPPPCGNGSVDDWSSCSASCGGGTQTRTVTRPDCGTTAETQSCNTDTCPKNSPACGGGVIGDWTDCSVSCGGGTQTRRITQPDCTAYTDSQICNAEACPLACGSGSVGSWSACSATCGGGAQTRTVTSPNCSTYSESQSCNTDACPPACGAGNSGPWSSCSATCGGGTQTRVVTNPDCSTRTDSQSCNTQTCPQVCTASTGSWSACSLTCGGGTQTKTTVAVNCDSTTETQSCNTQACPIVPTADIKANGSDGPITIYNNNAVSITWTSGGGITACRLPEIGSTINLGVSGSAQTSPLYAKAWVFNLNCTGPNGIAVSDSVTVNIVDAPASTVSISAGSSNISYNSATTITWNSQNTNSCAVTPGGWAGTSGAQSTGNLTSSKTYTVSCSGLGGSSVSKSVTVAVAEPTPAIDYFGIDPTSVTIPYAFYTGSNQSIANQIATTLKWSSSGTHSCSFDRGLGIVPTSGSYPVTWGWIRDNANAWGYSQSQTIFKLYCYNEQGAAASTNPNQISLTVLNPYRNSGSVSCPNGVIVDGVCQSSSCSVLGVTRSATFCQRAYSCVDQGGGILLYNGIFYCSAPAFRISD